MDFKNFIPAESPVAKSRPDTDDSAEDTPTTSDVSTTFDEQLLAIMTPPTAEIPSPPLQPVLPPISSDDAVPGPVQFEDATPDGSDNGNLSIDQEMLVSEGKNGIAEPALATKANAPHQQQVTQKEPNSAAANTGASDQKPRTPLEALSNEREDLRVSLSALRGRRAEPTQVQPALVERVGNEASIIVPETVLAAPATAVPGMRTTVETPLGIAEQIATEAVRQAHVVRQTGHQTFTMRLDPPQLGKLTIEMKKTAKGISLRVNAVEAGTLEMIQASVDELSTNLTEQDSVFQEIEIDLTTGDGTGPSSGEEMPQQPPQHQPRPMVDESGGAFETSNSVSFVA